MDTDAFHLQERKRLGQSLGFDIFYSLILAADIVINLFLVIINGNHGIGSQTIANNHLKRY